MSPGRFQGSQVQIVDIDDSSIARIRSQPWSHAAMAELLDRLHEAGAAVVGFDLKFAGPPAGAANDVNADPSIGSADRRFAAAMESTPVVIGFEMTEVVGNGMPSRKAALMFFGPAFDPARYLQHYSSAVVDPPPLQKAAAGVGFANAIVDHDRHIRQMPALADLAGTPVPSFAAEMVRVFQGASKYAAAGDKYGFKRLLVGRTSVTTSTFGTVWLRYTPSHPERFVHAADVISGRFEPARLAGKIVLIGVSAESLGDRWRTPFGGTMPGVEILAQEIEGMIEGGLLQRPGWVAGMEFLFTLLVAAIVMVASLFGRRWLIVVPAFLLIITCAASWFGFSRWQLLLDPVYPGFAITLVAFWRAFVELTKPAADGSTASPK